MRLFPAFERYDTALVSTMDQGVGGRFYRVLDANQRTKWAMLKMMAQMLAVLLRERPHVVISTGAAPGYMALRMGRLLGAAGPGGGPACRSVADPMGPPREAGRAGVHRSRPMIFVTVGVQLPFDRLIRAVDDWAGHHGRHDIVAQAGTSAFKPRHIDVRQTLVPTEFRRFVEQAELIVAHAGMGSIITALELGKRIVVMPRRAALGEHRNDHQLSTARYMAEQNLVTVADSAEDLRREPALDVPHLGLPRCGSQAPRAAA